MQSDRIETDYLIVGTGAAAMAFADTLLDESDADIVMVDKHHRPGGHWNEAYPFVRLHQPSVYYGVPSRELSSGAKDDSGPNAGLLSQATGAEVLAYFDQVMRQRFLASKRVRWYPMCEYLRGGPGEHRFKSLVTGLEREVRIRRKLIDATHAKTKVPSTHPPAYAIAQGVRCIPVNALPEVARPYARYTVVGSGKTGMDACLWLLEHGVEPAGIRWIMPRDPWLLNRANLQPDTFEHSLGSIISQFNAVIEATSVADLFERLEVNGVLSRIDPSVIPTTYRCAIVSTGELTQLRRIKDIVRLGHLTAVVHNRLVLEHGTIAAEPDTLSIDCSAGALQRPPAVPVFDRDVINLLMVRVCQPIFSAALIGYIESHFTDEAEKNKMCAAVPIPEQPTDWLRMLALTLANAARCRQDAGLNAWMLKCRLNFLGVLASRVSREDASRLSLLQESGTKAAAAGERLPRLLAGVN